MKMSTVARCALLIAIPFTVGDVSAQPPSRPPRIAVDTTVAPPLPLPPRLEVRGAERPVALRDLAIRSEIVDGVARTEVEMVFANPNARVLEGELHFPLLAGQEIDGFALDIDGELRDAMPVEKAKGKQVFEDTIRQRVDPALLESTGGENFRLRVYPMPANGTRRVVVRYSESLDATQGQYRYRLPLAHAKALAAFTLDVRVTSVGGAPKVAMPTGSGDALVLQQSGAQFRGEIRRREFAARGWIELSIPDGSSGARPSSGSVWHWNDHDYLYADVAVAVRHAPRTIPRLVGIVWDSSGFAAGRDRGAEFTLLGAYFKSMGNGEVELTRLRDVPEPAQTFKIRDGDWSALRRALQDTAYDGASDLAAWQPSSGPEEFLLFSDGLANYGQSLSSTARAPVAKRVIPVVAAVSANRALLRRYANAPGRSAATVVDLTTDARAATLNLLSQQTDVARIDFVGDGDVHIDPEAMQRGRLRLSGRFRGDAPSMVTLTLIDPDGSRRTLRLPVTRAEHDGQSQAPLAARIWARKALDRLEGEPARHRAEIRRIALAFAMVSRETSLIVLDDVADYVRHDIVPPPSLRKRFDELRTAQAGRERGQRDGHLNSIANQYAAKIAWWAKDYPKESTWKHKRADIAGDDRDGSRVLEMRSEPAPSAPPSAEPMASSAPMREEAPRSMAAQAGREMARGDGGRARSADIESDAASPTIGIALRKWNADSAFIRRFRETADADLYAAYLDERSENSASSAFFIDAADMFFDRKQNALALRVLSNLAEMELENRAILRILGYRLMQAGQARLAVPILEQVRDLAPFEPQSYRDLGLALAAAGDWQKAADALYEVAARPWDGRFAEIGLIALSELNALIAAHPRAIDSARFDPRLLRNLPVDLRVVLSWDADNSDMDLWVTDPNGERAYYGNRLTRQGGRMSADLTGGYGPEEFMLRKAMPGKYTVHANYYGNRQQLVAGAVTLRLALFTGFGTPRENEQSVILRLSERQETVLVGEFEVGTTGRVAR